MLRRGHCPPCCISRKDGLHRGTVGIMTFLRDCPTHGGSAGDGLLTPGSQEAPLLSSPLKHRARGGLLLPGFLAPPAPRQKPARFLLPCGQAGGQGGREAERGEGGLPESGEQRPWPRSHRKPPTGSSEGLRGDCGIPGHLRVSRQAGPAPREEENWLVGTSRHLLCFFFLIFI